MGACIALGDAGTGTGCVEWFRTVPVAELPDWLEAVAERQKAMERKRRG